MSWGNLMSNIPWNAPLQGSSRQKSVYKKEQQIDLSSFKSVDDEFSMVTSYLSESAPLSIDLLLQATNLKVMKGDRYYAVASTEGKIALVDSKEQVILKDSEVCKTSLHALSISPDEKLMYVGGSDNKIYSYIIESFKPLKTYEGHLGKVNALVVNPSNDWMVSASDDGSVKFWMLHEGQECMKDLYSHSAPVKTIDVSLNSAFIASGSEDSSVTIYETQFSEGQESGRELASLKANHGINTVKFSSSNKLIVTGDLQGEIILWSFGSWVMIKVLRGKAAVNSVYLTQDEALMITGGDNKQVYVWDIKTEAEGPIMSLEGHEAPIRSVALTHDEQFIVTISDDCKAMRWRIPYFEVVKKLPNCDAEQFIGVGNRLVGVSSKRVDYWDTTGKKENSFEIPGHYRYFITRDYFLYLFSQAQITDTRFNYKVQIFNLNDFSQPSSEFSVVAGDMVSVTLSQDKKYLSIGSMYIISTFLLGDKPTEINSQLYHDGNVYHVCISPYNDYLFSAGPKDGRDIVKQIVIKYMTDDKEKNELAEIEDFQGTVNDLKCTDDSSKLIIVTDNNFLLWSITQCVMIRNVSLFRPSKRILMLPDSGYLLTQTENGLDVWDLVDFELKSSMAFKALQTCAFFSDGQLMAVKYKKKSEFFESPLNTKHVKIIGDDVSNLEKTFFDYIKKIVSGKEVKYDHRFHNWLIMPFKLSVQHLYAYFDNQDFLTRALLGSVQDPEKPTTLAPYVRSVNGHTVLSVALEQDFPECAKIAIKSMKNRWPSNPYSLVTVSDSLIALNEAGLDGLNKFYEFGFRRHFFNNLPTFVADIELPLVSYSKSLEVDSKEVLGLTANTLEGTAVIFEHSCFEVFVTLGSSQSIKFLESLLKTKNERIFETRLVRLTLEEKWKEARVVMYFQTALYLFYLFTLTWYATVEVYNDDFLVLPAGFSIALSCYEGYQMYSGGVDYFKDWWNIIDLIRSVLFFGYAILAWDGYLKNDSDYLILIILASWIRGLTYFRIFSQVRYLINLIFEVFKDIPAFMVVFFYAIFAFSFIFYALGDPNDFYWPLLIRVYSTTLGNSGFEELNKLQWLFYVMITLINFVIMLNLLISILSDTYSRVKDGQLIADGKELTKMILEVEMMMFWRRDDDCKRFVHYVRDENEEEVEDYTLISMKFKNMNKICDEYESLLETESKGIQEAAVLIEDQNYQIETIVSNIKERLGLL